MISRRRWIAVAVLVGFAALAPGLALTQEPIMIGAFGPMMGGARKLVEEIPAAMAATDLDGSRGRIRFDKNGDPTFVTHVVKVVNGKETDARKP